MSTLLQRGATASPPPAPPPPQYAEVAPVARKSLLQCFEEARNRFKKEIATPITKKDPKRSIAIDEFLGGTKIDDLERVCRDLGEQAEDKANNTASKLLTTLDQFKGVGDALLQFAPESVSIVWFGISSLITIGNAKVQTRLLICGTCDSIATIVADCIRWEAMAALTVNDHESQAASIWESDVSDLVFMILEFLWSAKPHFDQSRVKRIGSTLKDLFTKELQQRVDALLAKYGALIETTQKQFQDSMLRSGFKTGQTLDQIQQSLQQFVSVGVSLVDSFQKQVLLYELDRQQAKLAHPVSYKLHFSTLNDRVTKIIKDRKGRLAANWLFSEEEYCDWKISRSSTKRTNFLCLRGPRGHGKSIAMMSVHRDITRTISESEKPSTEIPTRPPLVCHFFFKKGEQDIERARSALESILYQILGCDEVRRDLNILIATVDIINPNFGEDVDPSTYTQGGPGNNPSGDFHDSLKSLCDTIKRITKIIPVPVYLMIDALDECIDRKEHCFLEHLRSLAGKVEVKTEDSKTASGISITGPGNLKLVISARDSIDVVGELTGARNTYAGTSEETLPDDIKIINITPEKNSSDLEEYVTHEVKEVLTRRINRTQYTKYYDSQLSRITKIIYEKANGDFTLARLIIANLQQPSKDTLEGRIKRLPSAIGDIYMASLESLTPDEQEFVVTVLKWVVWSVSGLSILEISDHYKELYKGAGPRTNHTTPESEERYNEQMKHQGDTQGAEDKDTIPDEETPESEHASPYDNPEVKDTIYHIQNAGRDFFKFDQNTGVVNVDISIREWIQQDISKPNANTAIQDARGFNKFRDVRGNTVFQFTLTPSFVRYGDTLSQLFSEKEAHMSIALNIFRTLNHEDFQEKYMPWKSSWTPECEKSRQETRYEIEHWHDHIKALQKWWTKDSINDVWWAELLAQISTFVRPETWYRWSLQRPMSSDSKELTLIDGTTFEFLKTQDLWKAKYLQRVFEEPIHVACELGLHLLVDLLVLQAQASIQSGGREPNQARDHKLEHLRTIRVQALVRDFLIPREGHPALKPSLVRKHHGALGKLVLDIGGDELINRLNAGADPEEIFPLVKSLTTGFDKPQLDRGIISIIEEALHSQVTPSERELVCDSEDIFGRTPLCLAEASPLIIKQLLRYGANVNGKSLLNASKPLSPLRYIIRNVTVVNEEQASQRANLLQSAELLVLEGSNLDHRDYIGATYLHEAAYIRDLKFFKLLCVSGDWDVHAQTSSGWTPLHYLLFKSRPENPELVQDVLGICRMLLKMKGEGDLVNKEDETSRNALSYAVGGGFVEMVELLISMGADIHDEDEDNANCFHHLSCSSTASELNLKIADILLQAGLDFAKVDVYGKTPLYFAADSGKWGMARYFLRKYDELAEKCRPNGIDNPLITLAHGNKSTLLHAAAFGACENNLGAAEFFKELNEVLSKYTDTSKLILQVDGVGRTPLHCAVGSCNAEIVEMIIAINPDTSLISHALESALDVVVAMATDTWLGLGRGEGFEATMKVLRCISASTGSPPSRFPFGFLRRIIEWSLFSLGDDSELPPCPELEELVDQYEAAWKADNGWFLFDYAAALGVTLPEYTRYSKKARCLSSIPADFARPTRIGWTSCCMGLSDNRLEVFSIETLPDRYQIAVSDHPLPPLDALFYFEASFSSKPAKFQSSKVFCELGIRSPGWSEPIVACDISDGAIFFTGREESYWPNDGDDASQVQEGKVPNPFIGSTLPCVGCGINPISGSIFLTLDGAIIYVTSQPTLGVYYPFIGFSNYSSKCRINFGAEKFMFEEANSTDWKWDQKRAEDICPKRESRRTDRFRKARFR
ncbi:euchromatic histone-lysine N-methyltransferase [Arthrobotrys musiformis]|uniref:Euchromatic histone-lysine N-methyltransferase n=1 Tax=Arthrobotrys musiformis TaxID=47236 RepID=A0AAV9W4C4_9PEZI